MYNRVHMFGTHINATYNLFTEYLALDKRNNHSGPSSFAGNYKTYINQTACF